jgi:hypothetical protein
MKSRFGSSVSIIEDQRRPADIKCVNHSADVQRIQDLIQIVVIFIFSYKKSSKSQSWSLWHIECHDVDGILSYTAVLVIFTVSPVGFWRFCLSRHQCNNHKFILLLLQDPRSLRFALSPLLGTGFRPSFTYRLLQPKPKLKPKPSLNLGGRAGWFRPPNLTQIPNPIS